MTKRRVLVAALLLAAIGVGSMTYLHYRTPRAVLVFDQLAVGMTLGEVEAILGEQRSYRDIDSDLTTATTASPVRRLGVSKGTLDYGAFWVVEGYVAFVAFEPQDQARLYLAELHAPRRASSWFNRLRSWLGL